MWVVFNADTGMEIDRVETIKERDELLKALRGNNFYEHTYSYRWED
jgi:hypothetical protein